MFEGADRVACSVSLSETRPYGDTACGPWALDFRVRNRREIGCLDVRVEDWECSLRCRRQRDRGYLLLRVEGAEGAQHALLFYTRMTNYEGDQGFTAIIARWDSDAAAEYYGIIREIVGNWADLENNLVGAELPAELPQ